MNDAAIEADSQARMEPSPQQNAHTLYGASEQINELAEALAAAQVEIKNPPKTRTADMGKFKVTYAPLEEILDAVRPVLGKHGLAIQQGTRETSRGTLLFTRLMHKSGQWTESSLLIGKYEQMQGLGAAMTYFKRYSLSAMTGTAGVDDIEPGAEDVKDAPPRPERGDYPSDAVEIIDRAGEIMEREGISPEEARQRAREEAAQPPDASAAEPPPSTLGAG